MHDEPNKKRSEDTVSPDETAPALDDVAFEARRAELHAALPGVTFAPVQIEAATT